MILSLVALLLAAEPGSSADATSPLKLERLALRVPAAWSHEALPDGSHRYASPSKDASFELSVFPVEPKRDAKLCLSQLLEALGNQGFERRQAGGAPAARRAVVETSEIETKKGKEEVETQTETFVGCNGSTKWVLTLTASTAQQPRYERLSNRLLESLTYVK